MFINFVPTGMVPIKTLTPHVPEQPEEIIREVLAAKEKGAAIAHLHARDPQGRPTFDPSVYQQIIEGIREGEAGEQDQLILCVSTSGRNWPEFEKRSACLDLEGVAKPDMGSLTLSSLNFSRQASLNSPDMIRRLAEHMLERNIKPELEIFDLGMLNYAFYLIEKDILQPPFYFNLLFGNIAGAQADLLSMGHLIQTLPAGTAAWAAAGLGPAQLPANLAALAAGGGVRIGLEDNIFFDREKKQLATNAGLLDRILHIADQMDLKPDSPGKLRKALKLSP